MRRWVGAAFILFGCVILTLHPPEWDAVLVELSPNKGVHVSDALALSMVLAGIRLLWRRAV